MNKNILYITSFLFLLGCSRPPDININKLAEAIHKAEGNDNYGVLKGLIQDEPGHARYMCREIIRVRFEKWDGQGDFIKFLGSTYCPPSAHPLNRYWVKNVTHNYHVSFYNEKRYNVENEGSTLRWKKQING